MTSVWPIEAIRSPEHRAFVAERLLALKARLQAEIHGRTDERSLRLATWNLMHFGDGGAYTREAESMLYIAEIIDHFDLVAVQEVNEDLTALDALVLGHLGDDWDYIVTDTTEGKAGNHERLAFLYRKAKVTFRKEAGEIVLPSDRPVVTEGEGDPGAHVQFARTPFSVAFQSGWFKFKLCTVHIYYGSASESSPEMAQRREEIGRIAEFLANRQRREEMREGDAANYILLGDFNIVSPEHHTMQALEEAGFVVPDAIKEAPSSLSGKHHYDQIAFKLAEKRFSLGQSGVFDMFDVVYRADDAEQYIDVAQPKAFEADSDGDARDREQKARYYRTYYRRHQMSDHKLLWCEIKTDYSTAYLAEIAGG